MTSVLHQSRAEHATGDELLAAMVEEKAGLQCSIVDNNVFQSDGRQKFQWGPQLWKTTVQQQTKSTVQL